ncbi:MAG: DsbC family protein [Thiomargarita sp.]|nr:DsbC family protein [Thiomargarita sp.]
MRIYMMLALLLATSLSVAVEDKSTDSSQAKTDSKTTEVQVPSSPEAATSEAQVPSSEEAPKSDSPKVPSAITESLKKIIKDINDVSITPAPIADLYEVATGEDMFYITADGRYIMMGNIIDLSTRQNLTQQRQEALRQARNPIRQKAIDAVSEKDMVIFAPEKETKYTVNVFTDVSCGYCVKFHKEVPELNKAGVKVRYFAFPRAGVGSESYKKMVSIWCAKDRQTAMTDAKARRKVEEATCNNPIESQYKLGQKLGINGTPALILSNGELVPGYLPAKRLISILEKK